jgi:glutaredoxin
MLYYYTVYAKATCGYCAAAINILNNAGIDYVLVLVDKAPDLYADLKKKYDHQTVPMIVKSSKVTGDDLEFIGGSDELALKLQEEQEC